MVPLEIGGFLASFVDICYLSFWVLGDFCVFTISPKNRRNYGHFLEFFADKKNKEEPIKSSSLPKDLIS